MFFVMIYGVVFLQSIVLFRLFEFLFCFVVLLLWFMLLFSIRCCSPVFSIYPIEFCCIIIWAGRWERRGSNSLTNIYIYIQQYNFSCAAHNVRRFRCCFWKTFSSRCRWSQRFACCLEAVDKRWLQNLSRTGGFFRG